MAYRPHDLDRDVEASRLSVAIEELDLSSFGDALVPAEIVDVVEGGIVLESKREFPPGILLRIDFYHVSGNGRETAADEVVMFGHVKESREIIKDGVYRMCVVFKRLKRDNFGEIAEGIGAV
ncbi:MAG: hypothetical protein JW984_11410 [Deltaproteobacteria bacterium]|uniref:PilZ domain-containing protein n=1 Tax=Candidatus Zymogenus saltonus TaxID=2844893 RepID=A0A9D8KGK7_9DELT|nr:hypothetical protein [Candidatus Zymogenus saltonus]